MQRSWYKTVYEISPEEAEYDGAGEEKVEESDFHPSDPEGKAKAKSSLMSEIFQSIKQT